MSRAFTTLGTGADAEGAWQAARAAGGPVAATGAVHELAVPAGANPSRFGTWVQRVAQDGDAVDDVPGEHRAAVEEAAALVARPGVCAAVVLDGDVAERAKARAGAGPGERAYLLFGLAPGG